MINFYSMDGCPKCERVKTWLDTIGVTYAVVQVDTVNGAAQAAYDGVDIGDLPAVKIGDETPVQGSPNVILSVLHAKFGDQDSAEE